MAQYSYDWARSVVETFWNSLPPRGGGNVKAEFTYLYKQIPEISQILAENKKDAPKIWYEYKKCVKKFAKQF